MMKFYAVTFVSIFWLSACATISDYQRGCQEGVRVATEAVNTQLTMAKLKVNEDNLKKVCEDLETRYNHENLERDHLQAHNIGH